MLPQSMFLKRYSGLISTVDYFYYNDTTGLCQNIRTINISSIYFDLRFQLDYQNNISIFNLQIYQNFKQYNLYKTVIQCSSLFKVVTLLNLTSKHNDISLSTTFLPNTLHTRINVKIPCSNKQHSFYISIYVHR